MTSSYLSGYFYFISTTQLYYCARHFLSFVLHFCFASSRMAKTTRFLKLFVGLAFPWSCLQCFLLHPKGADHIRVNFKGKGKQVRRLHKSTISTTHFWDDNVSMKTISHSQVNFPEFQLRLPLHSLRKQPSFFAPALEAKKDGCFRSAGYPLQCTERTVQGMLLCRY